MESTLEAFAEAEDVQRRLDFDLDEKQMEAVNTFLEDLSHEARYHAGRDWPLSTDAPDLVRRTVIKAVVRWAQNMGGLKVSRAGDEHLAWPDQGRDYGAPKFTADEVKIIQAMGDGRRGQYSFGTAELVAHHEPGSVYDDGMVTVDANGGTKPFPFNLPGGLIWPEE